jgi:hypothetical protein
VGHGGDDNSDEEWIVSSMGMAGCVVQECVASEIRMEGCCRDSLADVMFLLMTCVFEFLLTLVMRSW